MAVKKYTLLIGGITTVFETEAEYTRYKTLLDLFEPSGPKKEVPHTNMEPSVLLSEDNPFLDGDSEISPSGIKVTLKEISDKEWEEKYESSAPAYVKKVEAVDPHGPQFKAKQKKIEKKPVPFVKDWVGPPFSEEEQQPQNIRYNPAFNGTSSAQECVVCTGGIPGASVVVQECTDPLLWNAYYIFYQCTIDELTPTIADIGKTVICDNAVNACMYQWCTNGGSGSWYIVDVFPGPQPYPQCSNLTYAPSCFATCATPHQLSYQDNDGLVSTDDTSNLPTSLDFDATRWPGPGGPPAHSFQCNGTSHYNNVPGTWVPPWSIMSANPQVASYFEIINWYSINIPGTTSIRQCTFNYPPGNCNSCVAVCDTTYLGVPYKQVWVGRFNPAMIGVDPATGFGGIASSLQPNASGGYWYDTWVEMMDDLIAAGEYVGNNTDSLEDLWNAGIRLGLQANGCTNCTSNPPQNCATPHQP